MLRVLLIGALLIVAGATLPFVTTWRTTSPNELITLQLTPDSPLNISWGDNNETANASVFYHTYSVAGLYNISIMGNVSNFYARNNDNIVDIVSWGDGFFISNSTSSIFSGCTNLKVSASPNTQPVFLPGANLANMFMNSGFNSALNWSLAGVNSLFGMFQGAVWLNQPITFTNTGSVSDVSLLFYGANSFNQPVSFDDMSQVTQMTGMFYAASRFNQPVNFNTSNVVTMENMFYNASSFNQPVSFDTRKVIRMNAMFFGARRFNQPVNFNTSSVTSMNAMFVCERQQLQSACAIRHSSRDQYAIDV